MPEHHPHREPPDLSKNYEQSELSFPGIKKGVLIYFIFTGLIAVVVYAGMSMLHETTPAAVGDQIPPQPYPLLQNNITARTDIWNMRSREDFLLHNYSYLDPNHQYVREPVDQALDQVAAAGPDSIDTLPEGYDTGPQGAINDTSKSKADAGTAAPSATQPVPSTEANPTP